MITATEYLKAKAKKEPDIVKMKGENPNEFYTSVLLKNANFFYRPILKRKLAKGYKIYRFITKDYTYLTTTARITKNPTGVLINPDADDEPSDIDFEWVDFHIAVAGKSSVPPLGKKILVFVEPLAEGEWSNNNRKYFNSEVFGYIVL